MRKLSKAAILEKNRVASDGAYLILLKIEVEEGLTINLVRNTDNITWRNTEWVAFPFTLGDSSSSSENEVQEITIQVSNINRIIQGYIEQAKHVTSSKVTLYVVNSNLVSEDAPLIEEYFGVKKISCTDEWVSITLGSAYGQTRRPCRRYIKNCCNSVYGSQRCGVSSSVKAKYPTCSHTLSACRERNNSSRYGGFPLIAQGGIYVD